ncbi:replication restart DNA helicase PriA [Glycomyces sambucus]|uniref:Probable replication restart protein PriA n=1 Tax=Glycomyces sambucus TaxID=380244 RepID=A0A1G9IFY5_9ACTN|nr:primosome assembly protein PriA [Glycomyces sambucus]SDL24170.1 replication restart DNA helicase PriA [Glycomyces sambucus]
MDESPAIAAVCIDQPLPQLDRLFDYLVPEGMDVRPGCRVRVRFGRRKVAGFVIAVKPSTDFAGKLLWISDLVSPQPVVTEEIAVLARAVADRYAGTMSDVLRLAVPERRVRVEAEAPAEVLPVAAPSSDHWKRYIAGEAFLRALHDTKSPRAVWTAVPGEDWPARFAEAAAATAAAGRGAVLVVPDQTDLDRLDAALEAVLGPDRHVVLSAQAGPTKRYRAFLKAARGDVRIVAGTRAAAFAPVPNLGLVAIWDDGDGSHVDRHAPYPHAREVLLTRAGLAKAACLVGAHARTPQAQLLVETRWAVSMTAPRGEIRSATPRIVPVGDESDLERDPSGGTARLPTVAWEAARAALAKDRPVLVQVPRRGYVPAVSCQRCRTRAACPNCSGPLRLLGPRRDPVCGWCGTVARDFRCAECGSNRVRAVVIGAERTVEELAQAFPDTPVVESTGVNRLESAPAGAAVVVATPGVEPAAAEGYGAVLLLDTWALLTRAELTASEEALRRWMNAVALARPDGTAVVVADGGLAVVQALMRWDPAWFAARELEERTELGFPPVMKFAALTGPNGEPEKLATDLPHDLGAEPIGPIPVDEHTERLLLRVRRRDGAALAATLAKATAERANAKADPVRVQIDPREIA